MQLFIFRHSWWYQTNVPGYGNCFTLNAVYNSRDEKAPRRVSLTGAANGLTLELYLDQQSFLLKGAPNLSFVAPESVTLGPQKHNTIPFTIKKVCRKRPARG